MPIAHVVMFSVESRNFRNYHAAACFAGADLFTM